MISGITPLDRPGPTGFDNLAGGASAAGAADIGASFAAALSEAAGNTVATLGKAEAVSLQALQGGDVQTRDVVDAVMSAEQSLHAAIAIRDKIVTAYLEISRMQI
jgi:flagellar hook-basal body complex protein FliE